MEIGSGLRNLFGMRRADLWVSFLLFCGALLVFLSSPVRSLGETQYTMMLGHTLLHHRTFALDRGELRIPQQLEMIGDTAKVKGLALEVVNGRVYKYAPPGSAVLSVPFVITASWFGLRPVSAEGAYDADRELLLSAILAALLMAAFAVACFKFARLFLSVPKSLAIAIVATFGTQVWSTASRVVEPDTWTILLIMLALYLLVAHDLQQRTLRPVLLASILSWCYFVHPTTAIPIIAITAYIWLYDRRYFLPFAATGAVWLLVLVLYSRHNFGQILPNYFQASRLGFQTFWEALAGNVISPSRGLLVYLPVLVVLGFMLLRYRSLLPVPHLVVLGAIVVVVHLLVISGFSHWWAGHSYGPRYWTSVVPWFVLLATAGLKGMTTARNGNKAKLLGSRTLTTSAAMLALVGIAIHARGALSQETRLWNARPYDVDLRAGRLWNWRYPQFLAGLIHPPLPAGIYPPVSLNLPIDLTAESANRYLWYGWSNPEPEIRWTEAKEAAIVFALPKPIDLTLVMRAAPFVVSGVKANQRLAVKLNGEDGASLTFDKGTAGDVEIELPHELLKPENILAFDLPDAESPAKLGLSEDHRLLGLAVQSIEFQEREKRDTSRPRN